MNNPTHLDLFSGIGGFALAAKWAGFKTVGFVENNIFCRKILVKNFPDVPHYGDIIKFKDHPYVDLITGGFPCQPFSIAGKQRGENDKRYLWPEILRVIRRVRPTWVVSENVVGLLNMGLHGILRDLEASGYAADCFIISARSIGAPHLRKRLFIVANLDRERWNMRKNYWETRFLHENKEWYMAALHKEWEKCKPESWASCNVRDWLQNNARICRADDGLSERMDKDRVKALGNAIVPQVAYPILKLIKEFIT